ncbi:hypothetical protein E2562_032736 [Oryza meyeriana var. granulata]|uniref:Uncharacterized protein n=1 Tax=Oryza meyeriana var. granulata TaxID=110450 RepID=A0A6G1E5V1_9ORYZ|nr:hypothetical protein E2562_032736 [Oryza meyeriana var. granulata]
MPTEQGDEEACGGGTLHSLSNHRNGVCSAPTIEQMGSHGDLCREADGPARRRRGGPPPPDLPRRRTWVLSTIAMEASGHVNPPRWWKGRRTRVF